MKTDFISQKIDKSNHLNQRRQLRMIESMEGVECTINGKKFINFSSNNSLGLAQHPLLKEQSIEFLNKYGTGSTASRLVCGTQTFHDETEKRLAELLGYESALIFNSGFQANLTVIPALMDRHSCILADKACHNSLLQGAKLSEANLIRFRHNDLDHLEYLLKSEIAQKGRKLIISESIFSMDGDVSDIDKLIHLANQYDALLYIDDAHAFGIAGDKGMGLAANKKGIDIVAGGFGKGAGAFGGYIGCTARMREYLIQFCSGFLYSTALPSSVVGSIQAALRLIPDLNKSRETLNFHADYLRKELRRLGFDVGSSSTHIIPLVLGNETKALSMTSHLEEKGILAVAIRPPTVSAGCSILRISLSSLHSIQHIQQLIDTLASLNG